MVMVRAALPSAVWVSNGEPTVWFGNAVTTVFGARLPLWKSFTTVERATSTVVAMSALAVLRHARSAGPSSIHTLSLTSVLPFSATVGLLKPMSTAGASGVVPPPPPQAARVVNRTNENESSRRSLIGRVLPAPGRCDQSFSSSTQTACDRLRYKPGMELRKIRDILGDQAALLDHQCRTIPASQLTLPSPTYVDDIYGHSDR